MTNKTVPRHLSCLVLQGKWHGRNRKLFDAQWEMLSGITQTPSGLHTWGLRCLESTSQAPGFLIAQGNSHAGHPCRGWLEALPAGKDTWAPSPLSPAQLSPDASSIHSQSWLWNPISTGETCKLSTVKRSSPTLCFKVFYYFLRIQGTRLCTLLCHRRVPAHLLWNTPFSVLPVHVTALRVTSYFRELCGPGRKTFGLSLRLHQVIDWSVFKAFVWFNVKSYTIMCKKMHRNLQKLFKMWLDSTISVAWEKTRQEIEAVVSWNYNYLYSLYTDHHISCQISSKYTIVINQT